MSHQTLLDDYFQTSHGSTRETVLQPFKRARVEEAIEHVQLVLEIPCMSQESDQNNAEVENVPNRGRKRNGEVCLRWQNMKENTEKLIKKWNTVHHIEGAVAGKPGRRIGKRVSTDIYVLLEVCVMCIEEKELTPMNFSPSHGTQYLNCDMGQESFANSHTHPCRTCYAKIISKEKARGRGYVQRLVGSYPKLKTTWYQDQKQAQQNCYKTFDLLPIVEDTTHPDKVGIHNEGSTHEHLPESCVLDPSSMNIPEHNMLTTANVPTLSQLWIQHIMSSMILNLNATEQESEVVQEFRQKLKNNHKQNGVTAIRKDKNEYIKQSSRFHVPYMIYCCCCCCKKQDKRCSREVAESDKITREYFVSLFVCQKGRCFYSNIPFSLNRDDWNHWSIERIDNSKGHAKGNVVLICRVLNAPGARRSSIWRWIQHQTHVPLTDKQRAQCRAQEEMNVEKLFATLQLLL